MADLNTIGFRVDARVIAGIADSSDEGTAPDMLPAAATITFKPSLTGPTTFLPDQSLLPVLKVVCELDQAGDLRPPANGFSLPIDAAGNLILISPQSPDLLDQGWKWSATFEPGAGQQWEAFIINDITGPPGDTVRLTTAFPTIAPTGTKQALVYEVETFEPPLPPGVRPGIDYLLRTSDMTLGKVVA
jgi:hypothetical protein